LLFVHFRLVDREKIGFLFLLFSISSVDNFGDFIFLPFVRWHRRKKLTQKGIKISLINIRIGLEINDHKFSVCMCESVLASNMVSYEEKRGTMKDGREKSTFQSQQRRDWLGMREKVSKSDPVSQFCENYDGLRRTLVIFFSRLPSSFEPSRILFCMICVYSAENFPFHLVCLGKTVLRRIETVMTGFDSMSVCLFVIRLRERNRIRL
jgi:hypothetical protein